MSDPIKKCRICDVTDAETDDTWVAKAGMCSDCVTDMYRMTSRFDTGLVLKLVARIEKLERRLAELDGAPR